MCSRVLFIDYDLPSKGFARWLGKLFARTYARWCAVRMANTSELSLGLDLALETLKSDSSLKDAEPMVATALRNMFHDWTAFVSCFTTQRDLLSHWRAYGLDGRGYCLGFDLRSKMCHLPGIGLTPVLGKVIYDAAEARALLKQVARHYWDALAPALKQWQRQSKEKQGQEEASTRDSLNDMLSVLAVICGLIKDETFSEENEVRALFVCRLDAKETLLGENRRSVVKSRVDARGSFVPYVELTFITQLPLMAHLRAQMGIGEEPAPTLGLVEIILPPQVPSFERTRTGIMALLQQYGYDLNKIEIARSRVRTYRS